jgi:hypothetical protein
MLAFSLSVYLKKQIDMEALKKTLFIIAMVSVTTYTIRHIYLQWFAPYTSVLDRYDESIKSQIKSANSLEQLEELYAQAHRTVLTYDLVDSIKVMQPFKRDQLEPYRNERELKQAIEEWETKSREIFQIRFYWGIGLILIILGFILYQKINPWLGITILIAGFGEMVYWTSPTFFGSGMEYNRLLTNKVILSIATLALLTTAGFMTSALRSNSKQE